MTYFVAFIFVMIILLLEKKYSALQKEFQKNGNNFRVTIDSLGAIIKSQHEYIEHLKAVQSLTKEKVDELASLLPTVLEQAHRLTVEEMPMEKHAAVIMYQKIDDARKAANKLDPDSKIAHELKEILE